MRLYKFGILAGNFLFKDNVVHVSSGKGAGKFKEFGKELYYSIFWWEGLEYAAMYKEAAEYVIKTKNKEIRLDRSTLLPVRQDIMADNKKIHILYEEPRKDVNTLSQTPGEEPQDRPVSMSRGFGTSSRADVWYPSVVRIEIGAYRFTVKVDRLLINPPTGENDFKTPGESI